MRIPAAAELLLPLSSREREIFLRLAMGNFLASIAVELGLSRSSVSTYRCRILKKTGFRSEVDMAHYAIRHEMIKPKFGPDAEEIAA